VSARHRKKRNPFTHDLFTHNRKLSKITVAMAGVTVIVPAAVVAGIATSGVSAGSSPSLLAKAGSQPGAKTASAYPDPGIPLVGAAREVAMLGVRRARAQQAAERAADRRAARRSAARRAAARAAAQAAAAATPSPSPSTQAPTGSAPQPSGNPQKIAAGMLASYGWSSGQFGCLVSLWNVESGWNVYATNPSGAYGIPQALPGSKMASAGPDWQSNAATQIRWGLGYIKSLYGSPCSALAHEQATGWY
jgi:hypothetical protein